MFVKFCREWAIDEAKYPYYIKKTLKDEPLNFVEGLTEADPNILWDRLPTLTANRYTNEHWQK